MQNKSINCESNKINQKLLSSDGTTFDDIWNHINPRYLDIGNFSDPRAWTIENRAEETFSKKYHSMSNVELSDELFLLMSLDPKLAKECRADLVLPEHKDKILLQAVLDITSKKPSYIVSLISNPLIKIEQAKKFSSFFNFSDPLSFQNSDSAKINEEMAFLGLQLKAFMRELASRWSR